MGERVHYFQDVIVKSAELELYGSLILQWFKEDDINLS